MTFTTGELLDEVEALIRYLRHRPPKGNPDAVAALKQIARELRGRLPDTAGDAAAALMRKIADAVAAKGPDGRYPDGHLIGLGHELIGKWPVVREGLRRVESGTNGVNERLARDLHDANNLVQKFIVLLRDLEAAARRSRPVVVPSTVEELDAALDAAKAGLMSYLPF